MQRCTSCAIDWVAMFDAQTINEANAQRGIKGILARALAAVS
jgi:hypothetical protein